MNFEVFDGSYVSRLRAGDPSTEQHFVGYFTELITLKLRSRLRAPEVIEDLKQETFSRDPCFDTQRGRGSQSRTPWTAG